jgi:hypothetical protein
MKSPTGGFFYFIDEKVPLKMPGAENKFNFMSLLINPNRHDIIYSSKKQKS